MAASAVTVNPAQSTHEAKQLKLRRVIADQSEILVPIFGK
jgi:hypothetical protein